MAKPSSVFVAVIALLIGVLLGYVGINEMLAAGTFGSAQAQSHSSFLGLFGNGSSSSGSVATPAWVGLLIAVVGASAFLFGLRALFVAVEGRDA
ncbi:MAG: hypothetical protein ACYDCK_13505 [Thermoplasmatota archaeon]